MQSGNNIRISKHNAAASGNLATKWDFTYDGDGTRTATLTTPYDANGQPQTASLTRYFFGGSLETSGGAVTKYYSFAGQTIAMKDANGLKYFLTDHLGSVVATLSDTGTLISQQRYLPFSAPRTDINGPYASPTDFGYIGQRKLDSGMGGIMDYKARFYSPYINQRTLRSSKSFLIQAGGISISCQAPPGSVSMVLMAVK